MPGRGSTRPPRRCLLIRPDAEPTGREECACGAGGDENRDAYELAGDDVA
ncbi:Hypothetical protein CAP_0741 [Chondromyces apiculatus DSM 436]|uniref:Uncharacterized protein n=1 Tax=Chondromyces apiculatus DSM 436 TaxID=1192034 RepID=A0A017TEA7_9BACT|nr:Hypothetical protein CAP_0741 [Chondromyces apiculatus DSM 436]